MDAKVITSKRDYIQAHIAAVTYIDPSLLHGEVPCPHYLFPYHQQSKEVPVHKVGCGGCKWQVVSYDKQLTLKHDIVLDCFKQVRHKHGELPMLPILAAPQLYQYRNKIEFSFGKYLQKGQRGTAQEQEFVVQEHRNLGMHKQGEFSKVVDVDQCFLVSAPMHSVYERVKQLCHDSGLPVYDAKTHA
ncbi:MAG: hypothetical protein H6765_06880 [Candidatus Peribacteria bacterium]|nr:MAG: hypothetical protein H6765_06880 [Candidatus Peribacteria bacterium]